MKPEHSGPIKEQKVKEELRVKYSAVIDDGIQNLQKALDIDKEYDDAMAYMNLLVRERADLVDNPEEYKKQIEVADSWVQKAVDTKKLKASRQPPTGAITSAPSQGWGARLASHLSPRPNQPAPNTPLPPTLP